MKIPICYEFCHYADKWTNIKEAYGISNRKMVHVSAYSGKQAWWLANNSKWYDGLTGIVATTSGEEWVLWNDTAVMESPYIPGENIPKPSSIQIIEAKARNHKRIYLTFDIDRFMEWYRGMPNLGYYSQLTTAEANKKRRVLLNMEGIEKD